MSSPAFQSARRFEKELTARQREVLDLIARGATNREIAERFGMTLDGAKWHVSEVLSKLNLSSREEAADYWRWRRGSRARFADAVRGMIGLPVVRWFAAGGAVVAALAVGLALFSTADDTKGGEDELRPFIMAGEVTVTSALTTPDDGLPVGDAVQRSTVIWAMHDMDTWTWSVTTEEPAMRWSQFVTSNVDGEVIAYTQPENEYRRSPFVTPAGAKVPPGPSFGVYMGPVHVDSVDAFLEELRGAGDGGKHAEVTGTSTHLGRPVVEITYGPIWSSYSDSPGGVGTTTTGGTGTLLLDAERMFIVANSWPASAQSDGAEFVVTSLDYDSEEAREFARQFELPSDAADVTGMDQDAASSHMDPPSSGAHLAPPGFLTSNALPAGFTVARHSTEDGRAGIRRVDTWLVASTASGPNPYIRIEQTLAPITVDRVLQDGIEQAVGAHEGRFRYGATEHRLAWEQDGIVILLTARGVTENDLLAFAETFELVPQP